MSGVTFDRPNCVNLLSNGFYRDLCAYKHIHPTKHPRYKDVEDRQLYNCVSYCCIYLHGPSLNGWNASFCITNNHQDVTITMHAINRHFLIWMMTVKQLTKHRFSVFNLKYTFIGVYWWTRQRIHNTLILVNRYLRLMGDKTIPDSAGPRLESFYPPFVTGIDLPHQDVVASYSLINRSMEFSIAVQDWGLLEPCSFISPS